jgi:hypothetical protein
MADNSPPTPASPPANRRLLWPVSIAVVLVLVLAGGIWALTRPPSSGASVHASGSTPTASLIPSSRTVYSTDWSHGAGGWDLPSSVQIKSGQLIFSGNGNANLTIPFQPAVTAYTITVGMEIDAINPVSNGGTITIAGQGAGGNSLYYGQIDCVGRQFQGCSGGEIAAGTEGGQYPSGMGVSDFDTGPYVNTYKLMVGASGVTFCFQGSCESAGYANTPKRAVKLVIQDASLELKVTSVAVSIP